MSDQVFAYLGATSRTSGSQAASIAVNLGQGNTDPQGIADPPPSGSQAARRNSSTDSFAWDKAALGAAFAANGRGDGRLGSDEAALEALWGSWI